MHTNERLTVLAAAEPIGIITTYLHGHFAEHLGDLVYPGICVPQDGPIANTNGIRNDVVDALRPLGIPVLRWPGGCFADDYHWQDGIGPAAERPVRVNRNWGMVEEANQFGTHEFMAFCNAIGAEPYFAGNVGSGSPRELSDWVEYCNYAGASTLANMRRTNGAAEPFGVRYWGVGNENWDCGGNMAPEHYAAEFCRYSTFVSSYPGTKVEAIACGPSSADWDWTRRFFEYICRHHWDRLKFGRIQGFAAHHYCGTAGTATAYTNAEWLELLAKAAAIEGVVAGTRQVMDEYDPERKVKLLCDEWGAWHPVETGKPGYSLYQQNTVRDAAVAAISLNAFHNLADGLHMANIAQLINVLQAVLLVEEDRCIKTPTYHIFDLYRPHQGGTALRCVSETSTISDGGAFAGLCNKCYIDGKFPGLGAVHASASERDGAFCVTAVNTRPDQAIELEVELRGAAWGEVEVVKLESDDIHAHNTFAAPERVVLSPSQLVQARDGVVRVPLAPGGIVRLRSQAA